MPDTFLLLDVIENHLLVYLYILVNSKQYCPLDFLKHRITICAGVCESIISACIFNNSMNKKNEIEYERKTISIKCIAALSDSFSKIEKLKSLKTFREAKV